jgi:phospholipase/carboxylesterase
LARVRPKVFWGRGTADAIIPAAVIERTEVWLPEHADATIRIYEDLGHSISPVELRDFVEFLAANG